MTAVSSLLALPKAELHLHLEGAAPPKLIKKLAARHRVQLPDELFASADRFAYRDFLHFLQMYDMASSVIKNAEDYRDVTYEYLIGCHHQGAIYVEVLPSADHAKNAGLSYTSMVEAVAQGIDDAYAECKIVGRIIMGSVRHFGAEACEAVAKLAAKHPHPYVVGFGMGGDEAGFPPHLFAKTYAIAAQEAGLGCTIHAGEMAGPESVIAALKLPIQRIGHGVRSIEDENLMAELADKQIVLECCLQSNIELRVYPNYAEHPFDKLRRAGIPVTLNSDDPPFFGSSVGREYELAHEHFGLDAQALMAITRTAIQAGFVDAKTKAELLARCTALIAA